MTRRSAFTLMEMLVVIGITLVTMAIAIPVSRNAIHSAKVRKSCSNLKQIHMAMTLYRTDHGGDGKYGVPYWDMGLPPSFIPLRKSYGLTREVITPPGMGNTPFGPLYFTSYVHKTPGGQKEWERYSELARDRSVLAYDISLDDTGNPHLSDKSTHYFIGMYIDGLVKPVRQIGFHGDFDFWLRARQITPSEE